MQWIHFEDLKEVCNAFTSIIQSRFYIQLSENCPYTNEIMDFTQFSTWEKKNNPTSPRSVRAESRKWVDLLHHP